MIGDSVTPGPLAYSAPWISKRRSVAGERVQLSHAVWLLVHSRHWLPLSALDSARFAPQEVAGPARPDAAALDWHAEAACAGRPEADREFFGKKATQAFPPTELARTRAICYSCPVQRECLTWALTSTHRLADGYVVTGERYGVWGGTTRRQRLAFFERIEAGTPVPTIVAEVMR